ncbi:MAG TPA: hypothetical protein VGR57_12200, partial [Ktedonobacterales bacterium]|nr:hypothetical protein [Ktedonobacterales bacterium]
CHVPRSASAEGIMAKYVMMFYGGSGMANTPEEREAVLAEWGAWYGGLGAGVADMGNPTTGQAKTVAADGSASDGGVGDAPSGYAIVEADSLDAAAGMTKGCPILTAGGKIAVYETFNAM